jgi:P22 coat protein - gene protein 5
MPTQVARTGSNLANGNFIPEVWSMKLQAKFYNVSCLDQVTNHDHEGEIKGQGSKVYIRVRPTIVISDYTVNSTLTYQDLADDKVELLIDKAKSYAFKCDDVDKAQSDINIINETTMDAAEQMKTSVEKGVFAAVYADATTQATNTQITSATVLNWIVDRGVELDELSVPSDGRYLIVPPWICGMIKKSDLKDASIAGDGTSILRNGRVGTIDRFTIYMSNNLSGSGAAVGTPVHCLAGTKHAITFASQFVKTETLRLQNTFGDAIRGLKVYGFKTEVPNALIDAEAYK